MAERSAVHELTAREGAVFGERAGWSVPEHFGDPTAEYEAARRSAALFDRSPTGKVEVSGPEAAMFLHNLSTNEINSMPVGAGCEAFFLNATARALAHANIYHVLLHGDRHAFWLGVAPGQSERLIQHLDRHLISEQVELADRTREFAQFHLAGPQARATLERALADSVPDLEPHQHMIRGFGGRAPASIRCEEPLALPGYDIVCLAAVAPLVWQGLLQWGARPAGERTWEALRVEAGTPVYGRDLDENRFAAEVGRTAQAISYNKGCYLGQEPVVMVRDRGQLQRTLLGLVLADLTPLPEGSKVFLDEREVGVTASSAVSPALGKAVALAYLKRGYQEPGTALQVEREGSRVAATVAPLPFPGSR